MTQEKRSRKKLRNDLILIATVLIISLICALVVFLTRRSGAFAVVEVDGTSVAVLPLSEDTIFKIPSGNNLENQNTLVIKDGKAYISLADCPDKICVAHRPISFDGESIICLPNKVVVSITESKPYAEVDVYEQ